eukprot:7141265-Karenia_brevis.AAC.1
MLEISFWGSIARAPYWVRGCAISIMQLYFNGKYGNLTASEDNMIVVEGQLPLPQDVRPVNVPILDSEQ